MKISIQYFVYHRYNNEWIPIDNNILSFYGTGGYGTPINKNTYNASMHLRSSESDLDLCINPHLANLRYVDDKTVNVSETYQCSIKDLNKNNLIKLRILSDKLIKINWIEFFAYKNDMNDTLENDLDIKLLLYGYSYWLDLSTGSLKKIVNTTYSNIHELYFGFSVSPKTDDKNIEFNIGNKIDIDVK